MPAPISILIIDDHFAARLGLKVAIENEIGFTVVAQGSTVQDATRLYDQHEPRVVLMDYVLGKESGIDAVKLIRAKHPDACILMLTISDTEEDIYQANLAGVSGYLTKEADSITLLRAINTVARGGLYFPAEIKEKILARERREPLSPRETEILHLIVKGMSNKEIGAQLNITEGTTKLHVAHILAKVGAADRTRAAILAVERGMVRL